jgi:hypothetical protein
MPEDWLISVIAGGIFLILGLTGIIWGIVEERRIFEDLAHKPDLRRFTTAQIDGPQPDALRIGGWIALVLGLIGLIVGLVLWLQSKPTM